ncbi:unnamed protein product, partial [Thlaspi arvense]
QGYSVVLPEKLQTGKWNVYRSARSPLKLLTRFPDHPELGTLHDNFVRSVETFRDSRYLGTRTRLMGQLESNARSAIGSALVYRGIPKGACVGLYFINRPEWLIVDHACAAYSYVSVPLYDTLGPDAVKYIVNHAVVEAIFCVPQTLNILLSFLSEIPSVRLLVVVGGIDEKLPSLPSNTGVEVISYLKVLNEVISCLRMSSVSQIAITLLCIYLIHLVVYISWAHTQAFTCWFEGYSSPHAFCPQNLMILLLFAIQVVRLGLQRFWSKFLFLFCA